MRASSASNRVLGLVALAGLLGVTLPGGSAADAIVFLDNNKSSAFAGIGVGSSPFTFLSLNQSGDDYWSAFFVQHPSSLTDSHVHQSSAELEFLNPFDETPPLDDPIPVPFTANSTATADYTASHGHLRARATATATLDPSSYIAIAPDERPPVEMPSPFFAVGWGRIGIAYRDEVIFASTTLPIGTPIQVRMIVHHAATISTVAGVGGGSAPYPNHAYSESRLKLSTWDPDWNGTGLGGDPFSVQREEIVNGSWTRDDADELSYTFDIEVGDIFAVEQSLEILAKASADPANSQAASVVDASNTGAVYFVPLSQGVAVQSLSGHSYAVPEPGAALLQAAALLALALCRGRHAAREGAID